MQKCRSATESRRTLLKRNGTFVFCIEHFRFEKIYKKIYQENGYKKVDNDFMHNTFMKADVLVTCFLVIAKYLTKSNLRKGSFVLLTVPKDAAHGTI